MEEKNSSQSNIHLKKNHPSQKNVLGNVLLVHQISHIKVIHMHKLYGQKKAVGARPCFLDTEKNVFYDYYRCKFQI